MFGRAALVEHVVHQFEQVARSHQPAVVTLTGEPGLGKTRFLIELEALLAARYPDVQVAYGRALASHSSSATFQPLREAISDLLTTGVGGADEGRGKKILRTLRTTAPDWLAALPAVGDALAAAAKTAESWKSAGPARLDDSLTRQFCRLISEISTSGPLVLLLDDLHWVDTSSVDLIYSLTQTVTHAPLMLVCAYREADLRATATGEAHPMLETLLRIERYQGLTNVSLTSLGAVEIEQLAHAQLGVRPRPSLTERLLQLTGGNPLFVQEYVGLLLDHGLGLSPDDYDELLERFADDIPRRIEAVVEERLLRLTNAERRCLEVAACIGPVFSPELLINAVDLDQATTREALRSLCRKHALIHSTGSSSERHYAFHHVTVANVLRHDYEEADPFDYQSTHAQIARYLIERARDDLAVKEAIAHHTAESGDREWAISRSLDAAEAAWDLGAVAEALKLLERVIQPLDQEVLGLEQLPLALTQFARAANACGAHDDVVRLGDRLQALMPEAFVHPARLSLELAFGYRMHNMWDRARSLSTALLSRSDITPNERAAALLLLGQVELCGLPPDPSRAIGILESGAALATAPSVLYRLEGHLGLSHLALGHVEDAFTLLTQAVSTATRTRHPWDRYEAIHWLSKAQMACLRLDAASASLLELKLIVDASGVASTIPFHLRDEARVEALRGVLPLAASLYLDYLSAASALATEANVHRALATVACQLAELNGLEPGRGDLLVTHVRNGMRSQHGIPVELLETTLAVAESCSDADQLRRAIAAGSWPIEPFHFDAAEAIFRFDVLDLAALRAGLER